MIIELRRFYSGKNDSLGLLFIDGEFAAFVIEDEERALKVMHETRIPTGRYTLSLRYSPKFSPRPTYGHDMITVNNVPGFTGILFHKGNTETDTSGCILVGNVARFNPTGLSRIEESTLAYDRIYPFIADAIKESSNHLVEFIVSDHLF